MRWSYAVRLYRYDEAPDEPGVYEIGFMRGDWFYPKYIGKAESSIRERLSRHYMLKGNASVRDYLNEIYFTKKFAEGGRLRRGTPLKRDNLYARWSRVQNPREKEVILMRRFDYEWNERNET